MKVPYAKKWQKETDLIHEQAMEENLTRRSRSLIPIFNATDD